MAQEDAEVETRKAMDVLQSMIDISADRLEGLRTQCATSAELTQQEIRTLEGKLIKLFSRQLVNKSKLSEDALTSDLMHMPNLAQWLQVVGLSEDAIVGVTMKISSLESLKEKSERDLRLILIERNAREEEVSRLVRALHNLRRYTEVLLREEEYEAGDLYWDSWDRQGPIRPRPTRSSVPSEESIPLITNNNNCTLGGASSLNSINTTPTHVTTPPINKGKLGEKTKYPTTPPPRKKILPGHQNIPALASDTPLTKSKSHESQLSNKIDGIDGTENGGSDGHTSGPRRTRLPTEPGPNCSSDLDYNSYLCSPIKCTSFNPADEIAKGTSLQVPRSPRTPTIPRPGIMGHMIAHRFTKNSLLITTCDYCEKQMFLGLRCKECKFKCHRDCESKVPPSCQLPRELLEQFIQDVKSNQSPSLGGRSQPSPKLSMPIRFPLKGRKHHNQQQNNIAPFSQAPDSSSNTSSCNSSTPSSPALVMQNVTPQNKQQFLYPDVCSQSSADRGVTLETHPLYTQDQRLDELSKSQDSDKTVSVSGSGSLSLSTDSERTPVRVDSQDSQVSDGETERGWPRQNSLSMREWEIPYDELKIGEPIGTGRFGTVYRGNWHGDVAIKVLNREYLGDEKTLDAFKLEVAIFRKTRHENLVLFMGACMKPPRLAIVSSLSKGMTLYTQLHLLKDKFNIHKSTTVAQQILQGMGYLHAKGIVHKDLKSKNIFLENGKVVITDFGLFGVTKLCYGNRKERDGLIIPPGWLCYLSPEIIRSLGAYYQHDEEELPFSRASDVYAFGTIWYELLCGDWPFKDQPPEAIIWQVGKGIKQPLANLQASEEVKTILMLCWSYKVEQRPDFTSLLKTLEKIPKKKVFRSPSHPIHLSRSAESVF